MQRNPTGKWQILGRVAPGTAQEARHHRRTSNQMRRAAEALEQLDRSLNPPVVLLVDDDPDVLDLLGQLLRQRGARVVTARSAAEAKLALERGEAPDLLLTDYRMPGEDGLQLLQAARQSRPGAVRVLMSGGGGADGLDLVAAKRDGLVREFFPKGPGLTELAVAALSLLA